SADVVAGVYATGWIKRGPVGLSGHTKGDALETIGHLIADRGAGVLSEPVFPEESASVDLLQSKGADFVDWEGYHRVEAAEKAAGEVRGRERVKIATREG
ncbi:pyridine nucleotide-disulfide oxidoreductase, partial [Burkholderia multivorans]